MSENIKIRLLLEGILERIKWVEARDSFLFHTPRVYEPAIAHKLAEYLQDLFPAHDIDIEYDKYGGDARKEIDNFHSVCTDNTTDRVRPDIIVHQRGISTGNVLVLEIKDSKASPNAKRCVREKLKKFTDRNGSFGYTLGVLWLFGDNAEIFLYINEELCENVDSATAKLSKYEDICDATFTRFTECVKALKINLRAAENQKWDEIKLYELEEWIKNHPVDGDQFPDFPQFSSDGSIFENKQETKEEKEERSHEDYLEKEQIRAEAMEDIDAYIQGTLCDRDFLYVHNETSELEKQFLNAWKDLYFVSKNSMLLNPLRCVKMQRRLLGIAPAYSDQEHLRFLTAWLEHRERINKLVRTWKT